MASESDALVHQLLAIISNLEERGLLNNNFVRAYERKPARGSRYFLDLVRKFCNDVDAALEELALALGLPVVDYEYMFQHYLVIKESTTRIQRSKEVLGLLIGASALALAVDDLPDALGTPSKEGCLMALLRIQHECHVLRPYLGAIIELERWIIHLESNNPGPSNN